MMKGSRSVGTIAGSTLNVNFVGKERQPEVWSYNNSGAVAAYNNPALTSVNDAFSKCFSIKPFWACQLFPAKILKDTRVYCRAGIEVSIKF